MSAPLITIFVRHKPDCKYRDDEQCKRCNCRKFLRWSHEGKQHRRKAGTRSWVEAESVKRNLEDQFSGRVPEVQREGKPLAEAVEAFLKNKRVLDVSKSVLGKYTRELERFQAYCEDNGVHVVQRITRELLTDYCDTWGTLYPSTYTRARVRERLRSFLRYCYQGEWLTRMPPVPYVKIDYPEMVTSERAHHDSDVAHGRQLDGTLNSRRLFLGMKGDLMSTLTKKVALVTGGSRGIGAAIAKRLAAEGATVAITYAKDADAASSVVKAIEQIGGKAIAIQADAADADAVKGAVEKTATTFGRIDVLVNNAGTAIPKKFEETTLEELDRLIDINVRGTFVATQAALKHMNDGGRIIMIGSCVGERAMTPGLVPYSATKGAVKMFTQGLSREVGSRGITVNNVQPGPIDTDLNPAAGAWAAPQKAATALDRYGNVDEVAALVAFVAGPEASYITGANLTVDGGTNA